MCGTRKSSSIRTIQIACAMSVAKKAASLVMNAHNVYWVSSSLLSLESTAMLRSGINGSGRDKIGIARSPAMLTLRCSNVPVCRPERGRCDGVCRSSEGPMTTTRIRNSGATREAYYDSPTSLRVGNKLRSRCKDMVLVRGRNRECSPGDFTNSRDRSQICRSAVKIRYVHRTTDHLAWSALPGKCFRMLRRALRWRPCYFFHEFFSRYLLCIETQT